MTVRRRIGALALCVGLVLFLAFSAVLIAHEADHDCCGEECPVCRMIAVHIRLLRTLGLAAFALLLFRVLPAGRPVRRARDASARSLPGTPVSWKIRLNN